MAEHLGFGKELPQQQKAKKSKAQRAEANQKFDEMKKSGMPVFNVYVRLKGDPRWLPAGSLAVERSAQIDAAIFQQEAELQKGFLRLYPKFSNQRDNLEYGHQLREFSDEEIKLAVRPEPGLGEKISSFFKQLQDKILPPAKPPEYPKAHNKKAPTRK